MRHRGLALAGIGTALAVDLVWSVSTVLADPASRSTAPTITTDGLVTSTPKLSACARLAARQRNAVPRVPAPNASRLPSARPGTSKITTACLRQTQRLSAP